MYRICARNVPSINVRKLSSFMEHCFYTEVVMRYRLLAGVLSQGIRIENCLLPKLHQGIVIYRDVRLHVD